MKHKIYQLAVPFISAVLILGGCGGKDETAETSAVAAETEKQKQEVVLETEKETKVPEPAKAPEETKGAIPSEAEALHGIEFIYSSGAGAWYTTFTMKKDGSFDGYFVDTDMGDTGEGYPDGTYYYSNFHGNFKDFTMEDPYTVHAALESISYDEEPGLEEIEKNMRMISTEANGLSEAGEVYFYLPGKPLEELPEEFIDWARVAISEETSDKMSFYGFYNVTEEAGFTGYGKSAETEYSELSSKEKVAMILADAEAMEKELDAIMEQPDLSQQEMNDNAYNRYQNWDYCLNEIWNLIREDADPETYETMLDDQRQWIKAKEAAVKEAGKEAEGGSLYDLVTNDEAADWTKGRVYELSEYFRIK